MLSGETLFGADTATNAPLLGAVDLRLAVLTNYVTEGLEPAVASAFERALRKLTKAGARLTDLALPELEQLPQINSKGGLSAAESYAHHREQLLEHGAGYDPRVLIRIVRGAEQDAADYIQLCNRRADFIRHIAPRLHNFDAILMPTTPVIAPPLAAMEPEDDYVETNGLVLRNPSIVNFIDGCAISLPCHEPGTAPVGLSLFGLGNTDRHLLTVAATVESLLS
jgi:aspartyl-tRNA(Asn)/glutamyl-tRNA(Gln) amidotransferase subunit A